MAKVMEKIPAVLKKNASDFIVEEVGYDYEAHVSENPLFGEAVDLGDLDVNTREEFLICEMEKKEIDHFTAIKTLASSLRKSERAIGYGGTKDRMAHTCQRISIHKADIEVLKQFKHPKILLKNFSWSRKKIKLGFLKGNTFTITMRDIDSKEAALISQDIRKTKHFANYFGGQRFGSIRKNNAEIGWMILKREFKRAIYTILGEASELESPMVQEARKFFRETENFKDTIGKFPLNMKLERQLCHHLAKHTEDWEGALRFAHRKNILMLVHATQSKLFNEILERGLEKGIDFTKEGQRSIPLIGYKIKFSRGKLGEIEEEVLKEHKLTRMDFDVRELPFLRMKGQYRRALTEVEDVEVTAYSDEMYKGAKKLVVSFSLPKGVYATTFLEQFFILD